jgi:hypothetical protein
MSLSQRIPDPRKEEGVATAVKRAVQAALDAEDKIRSEISELFLLLKSGRLTEEEQHMLKLRLDHLIGETQKKHECCG